MYTSHAHLHRPTCLSVLLLLLLGSCIKMTSASLGRFDGAGSSFDHLCLSLPPLATAGGVSGAFALASAVALRQETSSALTLSEEDWKCSFEEDVAGIVYNLFRRTPSGEPDVPPPNMAELEKRPLVCHRAWRWRWSMLGKSLRLASNKAAAAIASWLSSVKCGPFAYICTAVGTETLSYLFAFLADKADGVSNSHSASVQSMFGGPSQTAMSRKDHILSECYALLGLQHPASARLIRAAHEDASRATAAEENADELDLVMLTFCKIALLAAGDHPKPSD